MGQRSIFEIHHMCGFTILMGIISSFLRILSEMNEPSSQHSKDFLQGWFLFWYFSLIGWMLEYHPDILAEDSEDSDSTLAATRGASRLSHFLYFLANKGYYIFLTFLITGFIPFRDCFQQFDAFDVIMYGILGIHLIISCIVIIAFCRRNYLTRKMEMSWKLEKEEIDREFIEYYFNQPECD